MRLFHCDRCGANVEFSAARCPTCDAQLGYVDDERTLRVLTPTADAVSYRVGGSEPTVWRCMNAAWGCNWTLPIDAETVWCRSCRLTRGRPDESRPDGIEAWRVAEAAKRRLVYQLDELALPIEARSNSVPDGLAFDLVHLPGEGGITGHLDGLVTLDLAETDDRHREEMRRQLGEPFRTVIGHLRHEIGHHYWVRLVGQTNHVDRFRRLFGDERADYTTAVEHYYAHASGSWDETRFVTAYAASHPLEDWAESFAHYLHIVDAVDTAVAHHLIPAVGSGRTGDRDRRDTDETGTLGFDDFLRAWQPVNSAVNAIAETIGAPPVYPFEPSGLVVDKLSFVHRQIVSHAERHDFYAVH